MPEETPKLYSPLTTPLLHHKITAKMNAVEKPRQTMVLGALFLLIAPSKGGTNTRLGALVAHGLQTSVICARQTIC